MTLSSNTRIRGFFTRSRDTLVTRDQILTTLLDTYAQYGFDRLETPSIESQTLLDNSLPDTDRPNGGIIPTDLGETPAALRYDLTAPLARYCQEQGDSLPKPFLRAASGMVWRNEKPSPGRSREFWQCDADCVGTSLSFFPTMLAMVTKGLRALNTPPFTITLNDRRLLDSLLERADIPVDERTNALRTLDKRDRVGLDGVAALLGPGLKDNSGTFITGLQLPQPQITTLINTLGNTKEWIDVARDIDTDLADEWADYTAILDELQVPYVLDISIARGLNYYTGPVFEIILNNPNDTKTAGGAIGAGGAYDLYKKLNRPPLNAFGVSVGVDRLIPLLSPPTPPAPKILVISMDGDKTWETRTAAALRTANLVAIPYPGTVRNFTKRLKWADKQDVRFVVFQGETERANNQVQIKDLALGRQLAATLDKTEWDERPQQWAVAESKLLYTLQSKL